MSDTFANMSHVRRWFREKQNQEATGAIREGWTDGDGNVMPEMWSQMEHAIADRPVNVQRERRRHV